MLLEILKTIDFKTNPDRTRLMGWFFDEQYKWVLQLLQRSGNGDSNSVLKAVQQIEDRVKDLYKPSNTVVKTPFHLYGITFSLALLGHDFENALEILVQLHTSSNPQVRASADLSLLTRKEDIPLDVDAIVDAIEAGMIFQYPFDWYAILLNNLVPYNQEYPEIAEAISKHFEKESLEFKTPSEYKLFRFLETALYLTLTNHITTHVLDYLYYPAEDWSRNEVEELYVKRFNPIVVDLLEKNEEILLQTQHLLRKTPRERWHTINGLWSAIPQLEPRRSQKEVIDLLTAIVDKYNLNEEFVWKTINNFYQNENFSGYLELWTMKKLEEACEEGEKKEKELLQYLFHYMDDKILHNTDIQQKLLHVAKEANKIRVRQICLGILLRVESYEDEVYKMIEIEEKRFVKFAIANPEKVVSKNVRYMTTIEKLRESYDRDSALYDFYRGFYISDELREKLLKKLRVFKKLKNKDKFYYFQL